MHDTARYPVSGATTERPPVNTSSQPSAGAHALSFAQVRKSCIALRELVTRSDASVPLEADELERWAPQRVSWPVRSGGHEPPDMWGDSRQGAAGGVLAHAGKWAGRVTVPRYPLVPESDGLLEAHAPQQASGASELHALVGSVPIDVPVAPQSNLVFDEDSQIWRWHGGQACDVPSPRRSARDDLVARVAATKSALDHHAGDVADRPASGERYHRDSTKAADRDGRTDGRSAQSAFEMARAAESGDADATRKAFEDAGVIGRLIEPAEIAEAIAYLASERARATVGTALVVDAGYTAR